MKSKQDLLSMLFSRLAELQHGGIKSNLAMTEQLKVELSLLYDILGDEVPEDYWEQIEEEI